MNILDKYIIKQVIMAILIVALALLGCDLFFCLVHELSAVGKGRYTLTTALTYLALISPSRLYAMFPWSALIGSIISLGVLANHSELVVMRTASISIGRIVWATLKAALILTIIMVGFGEGVAPMTERLAQNKRIVALSGGQAIQTKNGLWDGLWVRQGGEFIHIGSVHANGELIGVTRYQFHPDRRLKAVIFSEKAVLENGRWTLKNVRGTQFEVNQTKVFDAAIEKLEHFLNPEILETAMVKHPERLSMVALWRTIQYRAQNELNTQSFEVAFWIKFFQPTVIIMMVFLAAPFVFGPLRRVSMGFRVVVGIGVAFSFHTLNALFTPLAVVYQFPPLVAVLCPILLFSGVGFWLLHRAK